jgi:hypothetical protein
MIAGIALCLVTATIVASVTTFNPVQQTLGVSRRIADTVVFFYLVATLGYWSFVLRSGLASSSEFFGLVASFASGLGLMALGGVVQGSFEGVLLFVVGRYGWWSALAISAASVPLGIRMTRIRWSTSWQRWAVVGAVACATGLLIYRFGPRSGGPWEMLAKVVLILVVPVISLLGIALRSHAPAPVRILATLAALAGVAEAAIH